MSGGKVGQHWADPCYADLRTAAAHVVGGGYDSSGHLPMEMILSSRMIMRKLDKVNNTIAIAMGLQCGWI